MNLQELFDALKNCDEKGPKTQSPWLSLALIVVLRSVGGGPFDVSLVWGLLPLETPPVFRNDAVAAWSFDPDFSPDSQSAA